MDVFWGFSSVLPINFFYLKQPSQFPQLVAHITGFRSLGLGARKFLVLSEKEVTEGHRGDLSGNRIINAKQSKVHLPDGRVAGSRRSAVLELLKSQGFIGALDMVVVSPGELG
jgi:hypothetical protein